MERRYIRSERVKLPHVDRRRIGGKVYKYHRITRKPLPADVPEDHPKFIAAWTKEEGERGTPQITGPRGSLAYVCRRYLASPKYKDLSDDYRRVIRRHVEQIAEAYGKATIAGVLPKHIRKDLSGLGANPARARRKAWRQLFAWASDAELIEDDPSAIVTAPRAPKTDGHIPWTKSEIETFRAHWPITSPQRLAFELTYWTAARRGDAARMSRRMIGDDGVLVFKQAKTGNPSHVPFSCALPDYADRDSHAHLLACIEAQRPEMMFVVTKFGKARSPKAFGSWLAEAASTAGVRKTAHGLRKSRLTQMAESGASVHAIMSWGGHVTLSEAQEYIATAERKRAVMGTEQDHNPAQAQNHSAQRAK